MKKEHRNIEIFRATIKNMENAGYIPIEHIDHPSLFADIAETYEFLHSNNIKFEILYMDDSLLSSDSEPIPINIELMGLYHPYWISFDDEENYMAFKLRWL